MSDKWKYILVMTGLVSILAVGMWQKHVILLPVCAAEIVDTTEDATEGETDIIETGIETDAAESEIEIETTETEAPLKISLTVDGELPGQPNIYRGHVMLSYAIEGGDYPEAEIIWKVSCYHADTEKKMEISGNIEELVKYADEWGIEIKKCTEEMDSSLVFSMEGRYTVRVCIADQNDNPVESEICSFTIDQTKPIVSVGELSKASGGHGIYGRQESPVAEVEVVEAWGLSEITYVIKDTSGHEKTGKLMKEGDRNPSVKWQGTLELDLAEFADGRIEVSVSASDQAGNNSDLAVLFLYTDTREPEVTFSFDTSNVKNEKYYACNKILQITVREDNFDIKCRPEVLTGNTEGYSFSGWKMNGGRAESTIEFWGDGTYEVVFECSDLADNLSNRQILREFTIDQTVPELKIQEISNHSSNNGTVAPVISFYDENSDQNRVELTLEEGAKGK